TREELDRAAPNNPVYLQFSRCCAFLNTKGIDAVGLAGMSQPWIERDAAGRPTGRINDPGLGQIAGKIPPPAKGTYAAGAAAMIKDLNQAGLTAAGISGCPQEQQDAYREMQGKGELTFRFMCMAAPAAAGSGADALRRQVASIAEIKLFQGDNGLDDVMVGE